MDVALLIARLVLAAVFVVAAVAKLADRAGTRQAIVDFGLPQRFAPILGIALPVAELAVAIALIPKATAWWGAVGAMVLLLAFIGGIGYNLARGKQPDCHCFGQLYSAPVGWTTLIRNGILALVAAFILVWGWDDAGSSVWAWWKDLSNGERIGLIAGLIAAIAVIVEGWLIVHLLGQNGRLLLRMDTLEGLVAGGVPTAPIAPAAPPEPVLGLPVGTKAPAFSLSGMYGETMTLDALRAPGKPVMLIFSDPGCGPCTALLPDIGTWQREHAAKMTVSLISRGTPEANRSKASEHGLTHVLLQKDREIAQAYEANGTPSAVIVRPDGTIGSALAPGAEAIRNLVGRTVGTLDLKPAAVAAAPGNGAAVPAPAPAPAAPRPAPQAPPSNVGQPAPAVELPDLGGNTVRLADFNGDKTLVLFWNPGCGFCKRMTDDLKAWEANPQEGAPKLLVVSTGTVEANREDGLKSTVVLDQGFNVGRSFGASGTPSAVLVDEQGKIASGIAVGAPGVLALARGEDPAKVAPPQNGGGGGAPAIKVGDRAPEIKLPDLTGKTTTLAGYKGNDTLVLFWNPGCGFCRRMLDDLKSWEANPPAGAPKLLLVSTGSVEANQEHGLKSTIVLDEGFNVGRSFGASGTPSAVLIDAKGKIASGVAVGAPAVLALAGAPQDQGKPAVV
jgi:peroxiredoxin